MTASERYEQDWQAYLRSLTKNPKSSLSSFLKSRHTNANGMKKWLERNNLSVRQAKKQVRQDTAGSRKSPESALPESSPSIFLPVASHDSRSSAETEDMLSGISLTFPDGTQVGIRHGSARAVMNFIRLYRVEGGTSC